MNGDKSARLLDQGNMAPSHVEFVAPVMQSPSRRGAFRSLPRLLLRALRAAYLGIGVGTIFGFSYLFGHGMLEGVLAGNDTAWALSLVRWFDQWFPNLPVWYPLQAGGTPLLVFYPPMTSMLSMFVSRLAGVTQTQALALVGFLAVPISATGIYALVWVKTRSQTAAWIAGLLYPLSSASWYWTTFMGMYAQGVSLMFFPWAFLLADLYIERALDHLGEPAQVRKRLILPAAAVMYAFTVLGHGATGFVLSMAIALHASLTGLMQNGGPRFRSLVTALRAGLTCIAAGLGMVAFWFVPFLGVMRLANREGLTEFAAHQVPYTYLKAVIGFGDPSPSVFSAGLTFALPVVILAGMGLIYGLARRGAPLAWGASCIAFVIYTSMPGLWLGLVRLFEDLWAFTQARAMVPAIVLVPALAGYGALAAAKAMLWLPEKIAALFRRILPDGPSTIGAARALRSFAQATLAFVTTVTAVVLLDRSIPGANQYSGYGPPGATGDLPFEVMDGSLSIENPPNFSIRTVPDPTLQELATLLNRELSLDATVRLDISPNLGGLTQALGLYSDSTNLSTYNYQSSIIHSMWGYQQGLFYGQEAAFATEIDELAKWFGIRYVLLHRSQDDLENFTQARWATVYPSSQDNGEIMEVRRFIGAPPMGSLLRVPSILVIGGYQNAIYEQVFQALSKAGTGYEEALLVEGLHEIDAYRLDQLQEFDAVLLHGYGYKDRERAWRLLSEYVGEGGALFADTGWQYWTPDWETADAPNVLPVQALAWARYDSLQGFQIQAPDIAPGISTADFSPLVWEGQAWGVSSPDGGLREWGKPVLAVGDTPIIVAGKYGQGKVVWSGMNLIGHASTYDNASERALLAALLRWLAPVQAPGELTPPVVQRDHPDHIRFMIENELPEGGYLLWREAYSPAWKARVESGADSAKVPIFRAGPGLLLLRLPPLIKPGGVISMDYSLGWRGSVGVGITILTVAGLSATIARPELLRFRRRSRKRARTDPARPGGVEWLPGFGIDDRGSESVGPENKRTSPNADTPEQITDQPTELEIEKELGGGQVLSSLRNQEIGQGQRDLEGERLIGWWRRSMSEPAVRSPGAESESKGKASS